MCPLCQSTKNYYLSPYLGEFLSCKELYKCESCDLVYATKFPTKSEIDNYYNSGLYYRESANPNDLDYIDFSKKISISRLNLIRSKIDFKRVKKVLDVGAGNAQFGS